MTTTIKINIPEEMQTPIHQTLDEAGVTLDEIAQHVLQPVMQRIFQERDVPKEFLEHASASALEMKREKAIASIRQWRTHIMGGPLTIDEIISARDEGRR